MILPLRCQLVCPNDIYTAQRRAKGTRSDLYPSYCVITLRKSDDRIFFYAEEDFCLPVVVFLTAHAGQTLILSKYLTKKKTRQTAFIADD